ncbi:hypothetical protein FHR22_000408 [Sphingopyxis panaciterrae]|uniref:DUF3298 and DUF4163 domain-containing protein n=1 Tax=Sphingopyxis panaciterrae TaxID=363841 RepID=UPI0014227CE4|nr:DUF3298 and DUF4163 domain-containing protein [Sphingopyxis panaciterrae]NIJ35759.1 hypothetical protein [Sphingopyxis panaciterrae]
MTNIHRYRAVALALSGALIFTACSEKKDTPAEKAAAATVPGAPPGGAADIAAKNAPASDVKEKNDLVEFAYSYPSEAAQIPKLAAWLDNDRATKREALVTAARRDREAAEKDGFPYHAHSHLQKWQRVTATRRFVSLSAEIDTYMGGAHGMQSFDTLLWDRNHATQIKPLDMFTSGEAFDKAVNDDLCAAIEREKAVRGIEWVRGGDDPFGKCPSASAQTVWLGSSDGRYLDRLTIAIGPYEIGPYAEGSYKINLPMSAALANAVKPDFARDFLPTK